MCDEEEHFTGPWLAGETFDDDDSTTTTNNSSIVRMVFDYDLKSVGHLLMTNYTWHQSDIQKLIPIYERLDERLNERLADLQKWCEPARFEKITKRKAIAELPIYAKCVDASRIATTSMGRTYHDAQQFLESGAATSSELAAFVTGVMNKALGSIFRATEIEKIVESPTNLVEMLMSSDGKETKIGVKSRKLGLDYELCHELRDQNVSVVFADFHRKMPVSLTNFLAFFCLHTIRHSCHVTYSKDGKLRIHEKQMHRRAVDDAKLHQNVKRPIKREKRDSEDYCEIIEPPTAKQQKIVKIEVRDEEMTEKNANFPEKQMLAELEKADLPMIFKAKFRRIVDDNQMLRAEIANYQQLIDLKIAEKTRKLAENH